VVPGCASVAPTFTVNFDNGWRGFAVAGGCGCCCKATPDDLTRQRDRPTRSKLDLVACHTAAVPL